MQEGSCIYIYIYIYIYRHKLSISARPVSNELHCILWIWSFIFIWIARSDCFVYKVTWNVLCSVHKAHNAYPLVHKMTTLCKIGHHCNVYLLIIISNCSIRFFCVIFYWRGGGGVVIIHIARYACVLYTFLQCCFIAHGTTVWFSMCYS